MLSFWAFQQYHVVVMIKILYQNKRKNETFFTKTFESYQTTISSWEEYLWHLSTVHFYPNSQEYSFSRKLYCNLTGPNLRAKLGRSN